MISPQWRSLLFVPADNVERTIKAATSEADAIILDLEDGVAPSAKSNAREQLSAAAEQCRAHGKSVVVRINTPWAMAMDDIRASIAAKADAIMVPKAEDAAKLAVLAEMLSELGGGAMGLIALIETPIAFANLPAIAAVPAVIGFALGTEDLSLAMRVEPTSEALDMPARHIAIAAAARGLMALAVPFSIARFRDVEEYSLAAQRAALYGANGAICIHPKQIAVANQVFGLSETDRTEAERIVAAWAEAQAAGLAVTTLDGKMIDLPVAERAKARLRR